MAADGSRRTFEVAFATAAEYPDLHPDDILAVRALAGRGVEVRPEQWSDASAGWRGYDAVVIRSCWDYFGRVDEFRAWLTRLMADGARLLNPAPVVLANMDKRYLRGLEERGASTVPTVWIEPEDAARVPEILDRLPWGDVVVKPAVSAGAFRTVRTTRNALVRDAAPVQEILTGSTALVQPFLPEIEEQGEWSFLYFGDAFSHAVVKTPQRGDFRVQWRHGGTHAKAEPPAALKAEADRILRLLPPGRLYSRVDGVVSGGRFLLVEVELIEPYLFFQEDPASAGRFADALVAALTSRS